MRQKYDTLITMTITAKKQMFVWDTEIKRWTGL